MDCSTNHHHPEALRAGPVQMQSRNACPKLLNTIVRGLYGGERSSYVAQSTVEAVTGEAALVHPADIVHVAREVGKQRNEQWEEVAHVPATGVNSSVT